jgi:hypothetical protein
LRRCHGDYLADPGGCRARGFDARVAAVIRVDALWLVVEPMDLRAGNERIPASVVQVLGQAHAHHDYS